MSSAAPPSRVTASLVIGPTAGAREQLVAAQLASGAPASVAVLLEGLPDGMTILLPSPILLVERIAPGCLCCTGNLVLRVTLNRLLRRRPERLYIGLASSGHLGQLRSWLQHSPYDQLLELTPDLHT
jgi:hypothetical protein